MIKKLGVFFMFSFISMLIQSLGFSKSLDPNQIREVLQSHIDHNRTAGFFVGIIDGEEEHIITLGNLERGGDAPITEDTLFEIGSITKTFTGLVLADMILKGEIKATDPVQAFLPDNVIMPKWESREITLQDLVTHSSGLPRMPLSFNPEDPTNPYADYEVKKMYEFLSSYKLERAIGEKSEYSNLGMGLLGHVLARKAGMSYEQLVKERILDPLGMADTKVTLTEEQTTKFAAGHDPVGEAVSHWDIRTLEGAGALRSTGKDMMKYLRANMGKIATPLDAAIERSQKMIMSFELESSKIGYGWISVKEHWSNVIFHDGGTGGFRSFIGFEPKMDRGLVLLINSNHNPHEIARAIFKSDPESVRVTKSEPVPNATRYVGDFQLSPEFILSITEKDGQVYLQATDQPMVPLEYKGRNKFDINVVEAAVTFVENDKGEISSLILHQNGDHNAQKMD